MTVKTRLVIQNAPASPGLQTYTDPGFGIVLGAIAVATVGSDEIGGFFPLRFSFGFTDLSSTFSGSMQYPNGVPTATAHTAGSTALVEHISDAGGIEWRGEFTQAVTDGIEINWTTAGAVTPVVAVLLLGGSSLQVKAITGTTPAAVGTKDIMGVNFEPELMWIMSTSNPMTPYTDTITAGPCSMILGIVSNDKAGGIEMRSHSVRAEQVINHDGSDISSDTRALIGITQAGTVQQVSLESFDSQGFTLRENSVGPAMPFAAFCLGFKGVDVDITVDDFDSPVPTGDLSITIPGYKPQMIFMLPTIRMAFNSFSNTPAFDLWGFGVSMVDDLSRATTLSNHFSAGNTPNSNAGSANRVMFPFMARADGPARLQVVFGTLDALGWTADWTQTQGGNKEIFMAIGPSPPPLAPTSIHSAGGFAIDEDELPRKKTVSIGMKPRRAPGSGPGKI